MFDSLSFGPFSLFDDGLPRYSAGLSYDRPAIIESSFKKKLPVKKCKGANSEQPDNMDKDLWCFEIKHSGLKADGKRKPAAELQYPLQHWSDMASTRLAFGDVSRNTLIGLRSEVGKRKRLLQIALNDGDVEARELFETTMVLASLAETE